MKHPLILAFALTLLAATAVAQPPRMSRQSPAPSSAAPVSSPAVEGWLRLFPTEAILNKQYHYKFDPKRAQCFTARGEQRIPTTCETLLGIGYADRARLTLSGDEVVRIDVLELQQ
jgi:hypothetical protein